jgi:hypothetical protein
MRRSNDRDKVSSVCFTARRSTSSLGTRMTLPVHSIFSGALVMVALSATAATPLHIESIQARLYFNHTGTFSDPLSAKDVLRNVIIGTPDFPSPSSSTLVNVLLRGDSGDFRPGRVVILTVTASSSRKIIAILKQDVGVLGAEGQYHAAFWLPTTGCTPLLLDARLAGTKERRDAEIPFRCAE